MKGLASDVALAGLVFLGVTLAWRIAGGDTGIVGTILSALIFALAYGAFKVALILFGSSQK